MILVIVVHDTCKLANVCAVRKSVSLLDSQNCDPLRPAVQQAQITTRGNCMASDHTMQYLVLVGISIPSATHDLQSQGLVRSVVFKPYGIIL